MKEPRSDEARAMWELLNKRGLPKAGPCSDEIKQWWQGHALPMLMDQALSSLRRTDQFAPTLIGFMNDGSMGVIDVAKAVAKVGGAFGDVASKDATAATHQLSARVPGVKASVFCVEAWTLHAQATPDGKPPPEFKGSIANHPDREEAVMFNMLHLDWSDNIMMQLQTIVPLIKVLGHNRSPKAWRDTKFGEPNHTDPMKPGTDGMHVKGRFIFGDPDNEQQVTPPVGSPDDDKKGE